MEKSVRYFSYAFLFMLTLAFGYGLSQRSWKGVVYFAVNENGRDPANSGRLVDLSDVRSKESRERIATFLLKNLKMRSVMDASHPGMRAMHVEFSQPRLRDNHRNQAFACKQFNKVELQFETDQAVSGEPATMTVTTTCMPPTTAAPASRVISSVGDRTQVVIPMEFIFKHATTSAEWQFSDGQPVQVTFMNVSDTWPQQFFLKSIRYYNAESVPVAQRAPVNAHAESSDLSSTDDAATGLQIDLFGFGGEQQLMINWNR